MTRARYICLLGLLLAAGSAQANTFWSSLWRTPDQRGEQLLRQGDAAAAARTFSSPARKAYAELLAGDFPAAARDLAAIDDSEAHYNRGNALAHSGDLKAALKAYDAALARDPNNRDARHNRELVARALKQMSTPPPPAGQQGEAGKPNPKAGSDQSPNKGPDQKSAASSPQSGDKQNAESSPPQHQGKPASKPADSAQSSPQAAPRRAGNSTPQTNPNPAGQNDAAQVRRDAEAGLGQQADKLAAGSADQRAGKTARPAPLDAQRSEQQLAQDQWLRQIPDDPGGLLRRKFMIEHLMRQQGNQP